MAGRKSRKSTAEDIIDIVAKFPWWVGVILESMQNIDILMDRAAVKPQ
ncbi:MAG: hypothetical protein GY799_19000 [Desulfobulbaceae bacterium]|nr:hypothetical protein [Desulfobulbaceae bacterium]